MEELKNTKLRKRIANYIKENYCFCNKENCASCLLSEVLAIEN